MRTCVALFRGINVGGKNKLPMREVVAILEDLGMRKIKTYIQSGNAVFQTDEKDLSQISLKITAEIMKCRGFEPYVLLLALEEMQKAVESNPFPESETDPVNLHLGFLASRPEHPDLEKLSRLKKESERFHLIDRVFYLHAPEGVGRSRLASGAEKLLGIPMTDRNWRTVCKMMEMAEE